jgi:hypothetical protein
MIKKNIKKTLLNIILYKKKFTSDHNQNDVRPQSN